MTQVIAADFLTKIEFLPDGSATLNHEEWLRAWSEYANKQVIKGNIKLWEVEGFDFDTGQAPIKFISDLYTKKRNETAH